MEPKFDWSKLTPKGISFFLFFFTSVISPGFLYFYLFHGQFFNSTDWIKLLFLSAGITLPLLIFNTLLYIERSNPKRKNNNEDMPTKYFKTAFMNAAWMTLIVFYALIGLRYFLNSFSSKDFLEGIAALESIYVFAILTEKCVNYFKQKNTSSS